MKKLLTAKEIEDFKADGAIVLRKKFDISWIEKLKKLSQGSCYITTINSKNGSGCFF